MKPLSLRAAARALGVALSSLQLARDSARITWPPASLEALRAEWIANTKDEMTARPLADRGEVIASETAPQAAAPAEGESRQEALRRKAIAEADMRELDRDLRKGELLLVSDVKREWANILTNARNKLLALPSRLRGEVPEMGARGLKIATDVVHDVLTDLADDKEQR